MFKKKNKTNERPKIRSESELSKFGLVKSFNAAIEGILYAFKTQRNVKLHFVATALILVASVYFSITKIELILLLITIGLVLITEMINTSIEMALDFIVDRYHPLARIAKDVAAGAVLFASINAVFVGYLIFFERLKTPIITTIVKVSQRPEHVAAVALTLSVIMVVVFKVIAGRGAPLRGGFPSGHAAVAFAVWTIVTFVTKNPLITLLTLLLAVIIGISRIRMKIHSFVEVGAGALAGVGITALCLALFM
ncbi:MAG: diacylglycerol kinase [Candidatus Coatesbacteria bacterium]|nr:MAG: diacylglycerol kinase [Candidatus Coatesbacteria bacterium]